MWHFGVGALCRYQSTLSVNNMQPIRMRTCIKLQILRETDSDSAEYLRKQAIQVYEALSSHMRKIHRIGRETDSALRCGLHKSSPCPKSYYSLRIFQFFWFIFLHYTRTTVSNAPPFIPLTTPCARQKRQKRQTTSALPPDPSFGQKIRGGVHAFWTL